MRNKKIGEAIYGYQGNWHNIPASVEALMQFTELKFTQSEHWIFPEEIGYLTQLTSLDLRRIQYLPKTLGQLTNVTELRLDVDRFIDYQSIFAVIFQFKNLKELELVSFSMMFLGDLINILSVNIFLQELVN